MVSFEIHIEGGGVGATAGSRFRKAWRSFFEKAGLAGSLPRVIMGRGRDRTFQNFRRALQYQRPSKVPLLLVDSETPLATHSTR